MSVLDLAIKESRFLYKFLISVVLSLYRGGPPPLMALDPVEMLIELSNAEQLSQPVL